MGRIKNLHVCKLDKFIPSYIDFIRSNFPDGGNVFYTVGDFEKYKYEKADDSLHQTHKIGYFRLVVWMHRSDKIVVHSLFDPYVVLILFLFPWLKKKSYWVMWGGDYINSASRKNATRMRLINAIRGCVIRDVAHLVTFMPGSVEMVRAQYGATGRHHECLAYTSNVYSDTVAPPPSSDAVVRVLVGNSANPTNQHLAVFDKIAPLVNENVVLYVPLSYGDMEYAEKVIECGRAMFGEKLVPMTELLPSHDYQTFLQSLDLAIFNHNRQQAMGTTINLLGMGKTVYMRSDTPSWKFLVSKGIRVRDIHTLDNFDGPFFEECNVRAVRKYFSEENLRKQWEHILNE